MKRFLSLILIVMMFLSAAAEEEISLSPDVQALQQVHRTMMEKYGHTHETLGLFDVHMEHYGSQVLITYTSSGSVPEVLTGKYFAVIAGETVKILWTYDGLDASLWQSGELTSPAWGVKQLTAYLDEHPYTRHTFCEPYEEAVCAGQQEISGGSVAFNEITRENRSAAEGASGLARRALQIVYGLSDEVVARLHWFVDLSTVAQYPDGHKEWNIMLQDNVPDVLDPITYYVTLNGDTGEILHVIHASGGVG